MSLQTEGTIILYARAPVAGQVKTRLARGIGTRAAAEVYCLFLQGVLDVLHTTAAGLRVVIDAAAEEDVPSLCDLSGNTVPVRAQSGADIGQRMQHSFDRAFAESSVPAILIGSDIPDIDLPILQQAFDSLVSHDVVLGPSRDGGYYLIGMLRPQPNLFEDLSWGEAEVYDMTVARARENGLSVALLPELDDIDTTEVLREWLAASQQLPLARRIVQLLHGTSGVPSQSP